MAKALISEAGLASAGEGRIALAGPVTFATAGDLLRTGEVHFAGQSAITLDLGAVTNVDSAGLALLLEWLRRARAARRALSFEGVPDKLRDIARLSGVEDLLAAGYSPAASPIPG